MDGFPYYLSWIQVAGYLAIFSFSCKYLIPKVNAKTVAYISITKISKNLLVSCIEQINRGTGHCGFSTAHENIDCWPWDNFDILFTCTRRREGVHRSKHYSRSSLRWTSIFWWTKSQNLVLIRWNSKSYARGYISERIESRNCVFHAILHTPYNPRGQNFGFFFLGGGVLLINSTWKPWGKEKISFARKIPPSGNQA